MRYIGIILLGLLFTGCAEPKEERLDISSAYWKDSDDPQMKTSDGWPIWEKIPRKGIKIGKPSNPEMDRLETIDFVWDETGIYGRVFAFEFPDIFFEQSQTHTMIIKAITPHQDRLSLGEIAAFEGNVINRTRITAEKFRSIDRGWAMKPGQCVTEFWLSWKAFRHSNKT